MSVRDVVSLMLELFSWVGITVGLLCLAVALVVRLADGRWLETTAVLMDASGTVVARWMAEDGTIFSRTLDAHEHAHASEDDAATVFFCRRSPQRMRFHRHGLADRTLMVLAMVVGGVGVISWLAGFALGFVPE